MMTGNYTRETSLSVEDADAFVKARVSVDVARVIDSWEADPQHGFCVGFAFETETEVYGAFWATETEAEAHFFKTRGQAVADNNNSRRWAEDTVDSTL